MKYRIRFEPTAQREFLRLPKELRDRISQRIDGLADDPRPGTTQALVGGLKGLRKLRVSDYRVAYQVDDKAGLVTVVEVAHRHDAYRRLARRW